MQYLSAAVLESQHIRGTLERGHEVRPFRSRWLRLLHGSEFFQVCPPFIFHRFPIPESPPLLSRRRGASNSSLQKSLATLFFVHASIARFAMDLMHVCVVGGNAVSAFLSWRLQATNACDVTLVWKSGFDAVFQYGISFKYVWNAATQLAP